MAGSDASKCDRDGCKAYNNFEGSRIAYFKCPGTHPQQDVHQRLSVTVCERSRAVCGELVLATKRLCRKLPKTSFIRFLLEF